MIGSDYIVHEIKTNNSWKEYFNDNFVCEIARVKNEISKLYRKRTIIAIAVIWILWALFIVPILFTGKNLVGQEIEISSLFLAGWILLPTLVCIFFIIGFNYSNAPREYANKAEQLISEQLHIRGKDNDKNYVISNFEECEKVSSKLISKRFWKAVFGFFAIEIILTIIVLFLFH